MTTPAAFQSQTELKPLPFDPSKLEGLSERLIRSHWENNYGGSVKALAQVKARMAQAAGDPEVPPYVYNDLKREHLIRTGSVVLHELYFENLGGDGQPSAMEREAIAQAFGSFEAWEAGRRQLSWPLSSRLTRGSCVPMPTVLAPVHARPGAEATQQSVPWRANAQPGERRCPARGGGPVRLAACLAWRQQRHRQRPLFIRR
ncbi:hypothetical protein [Azohydromonas lata]|uniref:Superoxide dismutase n=1 Tax=Azohydromonas lata TaxID=45677 RepID=A0ABU5I943_9BURK|nr:hypothetical protein [Azohydromonas lata]MDZ5455620.1 hypothetical protein [Azohydromonas lata]